MKDALMGLLKLYDVDRELYSLEEVKDKYPQEISERQLLIDRSRALLEEEEVAIEELSRQQRQYERELLGAEETQRNQEARFAEVTNNREYDALQLEIESSKAKVVEAETQILELIDKIKEATEQAELAKQEFEEVSQEQQSLIDELQQKLDSLQQEVDGVTGRRSEVSAAIEPQLLRIYDRGGRRRTRSARVAAVRKGACGGCFRELPAQLKSVVRRNEEIRQCESCGAILVWDDESA